MLINITSIIIFCADVSASDWYTEKHLKTSASSRLEGSNKLTTQVNALAIKAEYQKQGLSFNFDGEWQYDAVYDIHSGYSSQAKEEYGNRFWLNEGYFSWDWGSYGMSLGYQKIAWGQADDLRIVDVVNPLDLKDFVLFDLDEYRISQPMLRVEQTLSNWDIEGLWIFSSEPNQLPPTGSEFSFNAGEGIPEKHPNDGEFGLQAKRFFYDTDIALYAFRGRNDTPILTNATTSPRLEYARETMLGTSLVRPIGNWVARGELAWFDDREFNLNNFSTSHSDVLQWLIGIDYLYKDWLFTAQATDRHIKDWDDSYSINESEPLYTLSADATLASGKAAVRFAVSHADASGGGQLYQSKLSYRPNSHCKLQLNIDLLSGKQTNFFGQFSNKDRIWAAVNYLL
ncbi:MAG: hypothetical protein ACJAUP_001665 [Cellvibrionaceae bacterium]|jgi:hypothetical protein